MHRVLRPHFLNAIARADLAHNHSRRHRHSSYAGLPTHDLRVLCSAIQLWHVLTHSKSRLRPRIYHLGCIFDRAASCPDLVGSPHLLFNPGIGLHPMLAAGRPGFVYWWPGQMMHGEWVARAKCNVCPRIRVQDQGRPHVCFALRRKRYELFCSARNQYTSAPARSLELSGECACPRYPRPKN